MVALFRNFLSALEPKHYTAIPLNDCDVLRYEKKLEKEVFNNAIGCYIEDSKKNIRKLFDYAEIFNIKNKVQTRIGMWL